VSPVQTQWTLNHDRFLADERARLLVEYVDKKMDPSARGVMEVMMTSWPRVNLTSPAIFNAEQIVRACQSAAHPISYDSPPTPSLAGL
jgi:hypothetical protein